MHLVRLVGYTEWFNLLQHSSIRKALLGGPPQSTESTWYEETNDRAQNENRCEAIKPAEWSLVPNITNYSTVANSIAPWRW